jgi:predicted S18 family serine protease
MLVWSLGFGGSFRSSASPYTPGEGLAYCNLIPVQETQTLTSTKVSSSVVSSSVTVTVASTTTTTVTTGQAGLYLPTSFVLGVAVIVLLSLLVANRMRRK